MTRATIVCAGLLLAAGCSGSADPHSDPRNVVDPDSVAELPMPKIEAGTYAAAGDLAASRSQFGRAASQYELALKERPDDAATTKKLALAYVKADRLADAIVVWQQYVKVSRGADDAYGSLGYAYELAGKPAEAEKAYRDGTAAHADGPLSRVNYGLMLVRRNDVDGAVKQLSAVLKPPEVNYDIAGVYASSAARIWPSSTTSARWNATPASCRPATSWRRSTSRFLHRAVSGPLTRPYRGGEWNGRSCVQ